LISRESIDDGEFEILPDYPVIAIVGPTASGKSDLALFLAEAFRGEIVNYDSVQIFRYLDIGSAKPSREERGRVPHHMIDIREPDEVFTAGDYQREARAVLTEIRDRKRLPILVGGTGLYLKALTEGLFAGPTRSTHWRNRLESIAERRGRETLHRILKRLDPQAAARIAPRDKPKVIRALEVRLETGTPLTRHLELEPRQPLSGFHVEMIGLDPPRSQSYKRIDERVPRMFERGLVQEVRQLIEKGQKDAKPLSAIGYRHVVANFECGECNSWTDVIRIIQRDTRHYAKRQLTWFRKQPSVRWFDGFGDDERTKEEIHRHLQFLLPRE
jgi:tRNA dimethylallyltransferase